MTREAFLAEVEAWQNVRPAWTYFDAVALIARSYGFPTRRTDGGIEVYLRGRPLRWWERLDPFHVHPPCEIVALAEPQEETVD